MLAPQSRLSVRFEQDARPFFGKTGAGVEGIGLQGEHHTQGLTEVALAFPTLTPHFAANFRPE